MEAGQAVEELEIDYEGDAFELSFNARFLLDITDQIAGETAVLRFGGPNDPALVLDPADADVRYILMPLRV
jgi:DNA polymerase-3 subunit beta